MKKALCEIKNSWNSHDVSKSRHHAPSGIPNQLFFLSKSVLGENHGKLYQHTDIAEIERHITTLEDETISYTESIFNIIMLCWNFKITKDNYPSFEFAFVLP